jgi:hypothetical protein
VGAQYLFSNSGKRVPYYKWQEERGCSDWSKCVQHIIKEDSLWQVEGLTENGAEWVITYSNNSNDEEADKNNKEDIEEVLNCYEM